MEEREKRGAMQDGWMDGWRGFADCVAAQHESESGPQLGQPAINRVVTTEQGL